MENKVKEEEYKLDKIKIHVMRVGDGQVRSLYYEISNEENQDKYIFTVSIMENTNIPYYYNFNFNKKMPESIKNSLKDKKLDNLPADVKKDVNYALDYDPKKAAARNAIYWLKLIF